MDLDLKDKVAVVTGGARGLGKAIALTLAAEGAKVAVVDVLDDVAAATAQEIKESGTDAISLKVDVTDSEQAQKMANDVIVKFGKIDILVNNAGTCTWYDFDKSSKSDWESDINVCVYGMLNCCRAVIGHMKQQGNGRIVSIASTAAITGTPRQVAYQAAKAAVGGITRALAVEFGRYGIGANCVSPGLIATEAAQPMKMLWEESLAKLNPEVRTERERTLRARFPLGQWGVPQDIADMVTLLSSARVTGRVTGQMIVVDGGLTIAM